MPTVDTSPAPERRSIPAPPADPRRALRASRAVHVAVLAGGPALVAAAFGAAIARPNTPLFWLLLGAGAALVVVSRVTSSADVLRCAFCGAEREQVRFLVSGPSLALCPDCVAAASSRTADELDRRDQLAEWTRMFLGGLPARAPLELTRPYVELVAGWDRSPAGVRVAAQRCFRFGHHRFAQEILESIPEAARTPEDWVNLSYAVGEQGRPAEALEHLRRASPASGGACEPWILGNSAWYGLQLNPEASPAALESWLAQATEARRLLAARPPPGLQGSDEWRQALAAFHGIEAEVRRRLGDPAGALRALAEAETHEPPTGQRLVLRARALTDLGRPREAAEDLRRALALLRPGCRDADEAAELLKSLHPGG